VEVLGTERPDLLRDLPVEGSQGVARATQPLVETRLAKPWVITLFPTPADAANEDMSLEDYTELLVRASTTDHGTMGELLRGVKETMEQASLVRIVTQHPDGRALQLSLGIAEHRVVVCDGRRNFPDGEVFTSPDARSVHGEIFVDLPIVSAGVRIEGIYLKIEGGRIVAHDAEQGADRLAAIIETDEGSRRLGEVAFGMNTGLDRVLTHPLYVEKVAGTLHIAIGSSYKECYGDAGSGELAAAEDSGACNASAVHVDIVADARPGGCVREVWLDDTRLVLDDDLLWRPA
jgi:aminopeptidase